MQVVKSEQASQLLIQALHVKVVALASFKYPVDVKQAVQAVDVQVAHPGAQFVQVKDVVIY